MHVNILWQNAVRARTKASLGATDIARRTRSGAPKIRSRGFVISESNL